MDREELKELLVDMLCSGDIELGVECDKRDDSIIVYPTITIDEYTFSFSENCVEIGLTLE